MSHVKLQTFCPGFVEGWERHTHWEAALGSLHYRLIGPVRVLQQPVDFGLSPAREGATGKEISWVLFRVVAPSGGLKVYGHCDSRLLQLDKTGEDGAKLGWEEEDMHDREAIYTP